MARCAYPSCPVQIETGGDNPPLFCVRHEAQECLFPPCHEHIIPNSGWCQMHNDQVIFFDFIHSIRHQEALQRQQEIQRTQGLLSKAGLHKANNNHIHLGR